MATELEHHDKVSFRLTKEKALVFHALLNNINSTQSLQVEHPAEKKVLWDMECILRRVLDDIQSSDYDQKLKHAREYTWPIAQ